MSKIFVSYSRKNAEKVAELIAIMREMGYEIWYDQEASGGEKWWKAITKNIKECTIFVFALSPQSIASPACNLEYKYATDLNKAILPILLEEATLPVGSLEQINYVNAQNLDKTSTITFLSRSLRSLEVRIANGEYPLPEIMPPIPNVPLTIDPLAEVRKILRDIENAKPNELITAIFELKRIVRENEQLVKDAEELLEKITQHPYVPQAVAKEARETLEVITAVPSTKVITEAKLQPARSGSSSFLVKGLLAGIVTLILFGVFMIYRSTQEQQLAIAQLDETLTPISTIVNSSTATDSIPTLEATTIISVETVAPTFTSTATATNTQLPTETTTDSSTSTPTETATATFTLEPTSTPVQLIPQNVDEIVELFPSPLIGHVSGSDVNALSFSPNGRILASASSDRTINLWDVEDWSISASFNFSAEVTGLSFSPNGENLAIGLAGTENNIIVINLQSGEQTVIGSHNLRVNDIVFSSNGELIATASSDGTVKLWQHETYENLFTFRHSNTWGVWRVRFSPDNRRLVSSGSDGAVRLWDVVTRNIISTKQIIDSSLVQADRDIYIHALAFAADGRSVYIGAGGLQGDGRFRIWDIGNNRIQLASNFNDHFPSNLALIPSGNLVVSTSYNRNILFGDETLTLIRRIDIGAAPFNVQDRGREIESLAVHPTQPLIAVGSRDGRIRLIGLPPS